MADLSPELEALRRTVPALESQVYLANCSQGPLSTPVRDALASFLDGWNDVPLNWDRWMEEVEAARASFAALVGAEPVDVAIGTSLSQLVSSIVSALVRSRQSPRRRIVTSAAEFPGVAHAWLAARAYGWFVEQLQADAVAPLETMDVVAAIDDATAVVSVPYVSYANGAMLDLEPIVETAHAHDALAFVDVYQAAGTIPIDVRALNVDLLASGALKYLMGTAGIAFLYVNPDLRDRLLPTVTGWFGREDPFAFDATTLDYPQSASRFDLGTPPVVNAYAARAGIELVMQTGPAAVRAHLEQLSAAAFDLAGRLDLRILGPKTPESKGATTAFDAGSAERADEVAEALRERDVIVAPRGRAVRLAPHGFTRQDELEHAITELAGVLAAART
ncbi:MAG TPA: aminotransferase class V-fold PLP-dependent enzyme [Actinomycetota bacterium]